MEAIFTFCVSLQFDIYAVIGNSYTKACALGFVFLFAFIVTNFGLEFEDQRYNKKGNYDHKSCNMPFPGGIRAFNDGGVDQVRHMLLSFESSY